MNLLSKLVFRFKNHVATPIDRIYRRSINRNRLLSPLFVTGAMGSGTTLVAFEATQCFEVAGVVDESALEIRRSSALKILPIAKHSSISEYMKSLLPSKSWNPDQERDALLHLYRGHAKTNSSFIIDKAPNASLVRAEFLLRCFPDAYFIFVYRDPVANIEGFRRKWPLFKRSSLQENIHFYREIHERFLDAASAFPERVITTPYEALVENRDAAMAAIQSRTGLKTRQSRAQLATKPNRPGQGIRNVSNKKIHIVSDANAKAYQSLTVDEISQIQESLSDLGENLKNWTTRQNKQNIQ